MSGMPYCFNCHTPADEVPGWELEAKIEGVSIEQYARMDGTYNSVSNQFCCDMCYLGMGAPSSRTGWTAP